MFELSAERRDALQERAKADPAWRDRERHRLAAMVQSLERDELDAVASRDYPRAAELREFVNERRAELDVLGGPGGLSDSSGRPKSSRELWRKAMSKQPSDASASMGGERSSRAMWRKAMKRCAR